MNRTEQISLVKPLNSIPWSSLASQHPSLLTSVINHEEIDMPFKYAAIVAYHYTEQTVFDATQSI